MLRSVIFSDAALDTFAFSYLIAIWWKLIASHLKSFLVDGFLAAKLSVAYSSVSVSVLQSIH